MQTGQDFDYGIAGKYLFYPTLKVIPSSGNMVLAFGMSSRSDYPGIEVSEQVATDPADTLEKPAVAQKGIAPLALLFGCWPNGCRYGDYFGSGLDPSHPGVVWAAGEYASGQNDTSGLGTGWGTKIANFTG